LRRIVKAKADLGPIITTIPGRSKANQIYPEEGQESAKLKKKRTKQHKSTWRRRKIRQAQDRCTRMYNHK
jgi:hypothetical protein